MRKFLFILLLFTFRRTYFNGLQHIFRARLRKVSNYKKKRQREVNRFKLVVKSRSFEIFKLVEEPRNNLACKIRGYIFTETYTQFKKLFCTKQKKGKVLGTCLISTVNSKNVYFRHKQYYCSRNKCGRVGSLLGR